MTQMPEVVNHIVWFINHWAYDPSGIWKRFRVAMSPAEIEVYKAYCADCNLNFLYAIRGVPIITEAHPEDPQYYLEYTHK